MNSLVTVHLSPVWVLAQCCLLTLAFSLRVTIPTFTLSWLSIPWHLPTKIYICPSLSLLLPLNIGLPKTPPGLVLDRCHEPCPSVIPQHWPTKAQHWPLSLDPVLPQHWSDQDYPSLDPVLPQCWSNPDYCDLESVIEVKPRQLHQMADSTNPSLGGRVIQWYYLWGYSKNY